MAPAGQVAQATRKVAEVGDDHVRAQAHRVLFLLNAMMFVVVHVWL